MNRIVILLGSHGQGSGAERVLEYLLDGAAAENRQEQIVLLSPTSSSVTTFARERGFRWIPWAAGRDSLSENLRAAKDHFFTIAPGDVVHSWHTRHLEWAWMLGRRWRIPSAGTIHDDPAPLHGQFGAIRKGIIRTAAHGLDGVVAVSDAISRRCEELGWTREITTIRNGLPDAPPSSREVGPPTRLGFMATAVRWKGLELLPDLIARTSDLPVVWNLFGGQLPETAPLLAQLSRTPRVHYHGRVALEEAFSRTDILLHLSQALDPYPTVLLEAARAGIPAIATDTGGSAEIVHDQRTGLLVTPGDHAAVEAAIRDLVARPEKRGAMSGCARRRFEEEFGVARMVADYFSFWNLLRSSRR